ncbi:MAG: GldG family protein [Synergistaceae bacterium]|jgi:hypothetical protein|nr:GldG family protein [Synergistaceae bacterium]
MAGLDETKPRAWKRASKLAASAMQKGGVWTIAMAAVTLACAVLVTLLAEEAEDRFGLHWDLTRNRVYSISEATRNVLSLLDGEIVIYTVYPTGEEDMTIGELLRRYEMASPCVTVRNIDPVRSPLFTRQFEGDGGRIENSSIIVTKAGEGNDYRVIKAQNLYEWRLDDDRLYAVGLVAEQRVTSAILSLMGGPQPRAYFVEGHGERRMSDLYYLSGLLENENYVVQSYNLIYNDVRLAENDLLFFAAPARDLNDEEVGLLEEFFKNGGRAAFYIDIFAPKMPNFERALGLFGLGLRPELMVESDAERFLNDTVILSPLAEDHPATSMLRESGLSPVMPRCRGVSITEVTGVRNSALYVTSNKSFGKTDPLSSTLEREEHDIEGPFALAAAAENLEDKSRILLFGSTDFITSFEAVRFAGNLAAFMGGVIWLSGQGMSVAIQPKSLVDPPLQLGSSSDVFSLMALVICVIPLAVLVLGYAVWRRRLSD